MAQSVKLADEIMALVCREADLHSRSVAGQITHWLKIGRAIEHSHDTIATASVNRQPYRFSISLHQLQVLMLP